MPKRLISFGRFIILRANIKSSTQIILTEYEISYQRSDSLRKELSYAEYMELVHNGITTQAGNCPVTPLLEMLQGRWKFQIIYELCIQSPIRFGELKKALGGITNTMLTSSLRELEQDGLVDRVQFNEIPPHVEYSLSDKGKDLLPVFYEMTKWGFQYLE